MKRSEAFTKAFEAAMGLAEPADTVDLEQREPMLYKWQVQLILRNLDKDLDNG